MERGGSQVRVLLFSLFGADGEGRRPGSDAGGAGTDVHADAIADASAYTTAAAPGRERHGLGHPGRGDGAGDQDRHLGRRDPEGGQRAGDAGASFGRSLRHLLLRVGRAERLLVHLDPRRPDDASQPDVRRGASERPRGLDLLLRELRGLRRRPREPPDPARASARPPGAPPRTEAPSASRASSRPRASASRRGSGPDPSGRDVSAPRSSRGASAPT